jgi:MtrB/PioB family decaheme-associated outer membrane protein
MSARKSNTFRVSAIALATLAAMQAARAEEPADAVKELTTPQSSVSVGVATASGDEADRARFGMFNGMRKNEASLLFDGVYSRRDDSSGYWTQLIMRNLGLENRELRFITGRQGDWKVGAEYSAIVRRDPRTINTGVTGIDGPNQTVVLLTAPGAGRDVNLSMKREGASVSVEKWLARNLQIEASAKVENKNGARFFGKGFTCASVTAPGCLAASATSAVTGWALLMLPEPIDSTIRQFEVKANFNIGALFLSAGYYGNLYSNANGAIIPNVPGTLLNPVGTPLPLSNGLQAIMNQPVALPPDSEAHQFSLGGNYRFSPTSALNFKFSRTRAKQNEAFPSVFAPPPGVTNLGGRIDTTLAQVGFGARPWRDVSVSGNIRYEDKEDKTPLALYNIIGTPTATNPMTFTNTPLSPSKLNAKAEVNIRLPDRYRVVFGVDQEKLDHGEFPQTSSVGGLSGIRQKTKEDGYRIELRRSMSETFTGSLSWSSHDRDGDSPWLKPTSVSATVGPQTGVVVADPSPTCVPPVGQFNNCIYGRTAIFPFVFMDRQREKLRIAANFNPAENFSIQIYGDDGKDRYSGPTEHGLRKFAFRMGGIDVSWAINETWNLTAYAMNGKQSTDAGHSTGYDATLTDDNTTGGLSLTGSFGPKWKVGADLSSVNDVLQYFQQQDPLASAANTRFLAEQGGLPDVTYRLQSLRLFAQYEINRQNAVRFDFVHHDTMFDEWTYNFRGVPFRFSDNTTLNAQQRQRVNYLGVSYQYRFR